MSNPLTSCIRLRLETSKKGKTTIYARVYNKLTWANLAIDDLDRELWDAESKWPVLDSRTEKVRARLIAVRTLAADLLKQYIDQNLLDGPDYKTDLLERFASWEGQYANLAVAPVEGESIRDPLEDEAH